jgi:hypothetical protein
MIKLFCPLSAFAYVSADVSTRSRIATYDESSDGADSSDALAGTVVELNLDDVLLGLRKS